jgi:hypothetical protein
VGIFHKENETEVAVAFDLSRLEWQFMVSSNVTMKKSTSDAAKDLENQPSQTLEGDHFLRLVDVCTSTVIYGSMLTS